MTFPTIPTAAAGRVLSVLATNPAGTHTSPDLSSLTKNAGDLLIAIVIIYDGNSTNAEFSSWGGGFTEFVDQATTATMGIGCAYKFSTGSETGTFTVTSADTSGNDSAFFLLSIAGAHASTPPEGGTIANGTSAAADPGSLNPGGWGTEDTLWIAVCGVGEVSTTGSWTGAASAPANYTDYVDTGLSADVAGAVEGALAFRQLNAASEDVGTFSVDVSNARNSALLLAVRPAEPTGTGGISVPSATVSGTGEQVLTATGAVSVPPATVAGTGEEVFTATGAVTGQASTVAGTGDHTLAEPEATGAIAVPAATVTGTGSLGLTATGAVSVPSVTVAGTASEGMTATGAVTGAAATIAGSGLHIQPVTGTGAILGRAPTVSGSGTHPVEEMESSAAELRKWVVEPAPVFLALEAELPMPSMGIRGRHAGPFSGRMEITAAESSVRMRVRNTTPDKVRRRELEDAKLLAALIEGDEVL